MMNKEGKCCSISRNIDCNSKQIEQMESTLNKTHAINHDKTDTNMIKIPGGKYLMGTNDRDSIASDYEGPIKEVKVESFLIDPYAVTNEKFNEFVKKTNYKTVAERFGWSFIFYKLLTEDAQMDVIDNEFYNKHWWRPVKGANWYRPYGRGSNISEILDHPVVHISWIDAQAYAEWAGKRLLNEVEWEYAARGGLSQRRYPWGDNLIEGDEYFCNIWQGDFPHTNTLEDGYLGTAPVDAFKPNGYGLYNMAGNVWEWCSNSFVNKYELFHKSSNDSEENKDDKKAMRGGSYLCHHSYCNRYRVSARTSNTPDSSSGNLGFRCAKTIN